MRRVAALFFVMISLLAFAPAAAADTTGEPGGRPRQSYEGIGFFAYSSECGAQTCTDTYVYAEEGTTSSGETFEYVCVDQYTYNIRTGRGDYASGCTETTNLTVANDLSSATLSPTDVELCGSARRCETVTVAAELEGTGETATYRWRGSYKDGTCSFTYSDSGKEQFATGTITLDGETMDAQGSIRSYKSTYTERCR